MKNRLLLFVAPLLLIAACKSNTGHVSEICNVDRFSMVMDSIGGNAQLLDVRTPDEYNRGHLPGAINIDWNSSDFADKTSVTLDKSKPVMVYCLSGGRSSEASEWLEKHGYNTVYHLEGGVRAWSQAGKPMEQGNATPAAASSAQEGQITTAAYASLVKSQPIVLVDFSATWCGPCRILAPRLEALKEEMPGKFLLVKVDADLSSAVADSMKVTALPTLYLYKNGQVVWRNEGLVSKETVADAINNK